MDWQRTLLDDLFELDPVTRQRRYRIAYIGMPRKNGKSTLAAGLALYGLIMDGEPGAEVYSCAGDRKQASIVFGEARRMAMADPELADLITPRQHHLEVPATNGVYRVLSADAALQQGLNPSFVVFDEVHVQPSGDLWDAMTLGSGTRRQPLIIGITTAGWDEGSLAYRLYDYGRKVARGEIDDPTFFFRWWEPPEGADHRAPETWQAANPALGGFLKLDDFTTAVRTTPESAFRRFRCNQWVAAADYWLPLGAWEDCADPTVALDPKLPLAVGIDIGITHDATAVVCAQWQEKQDRLVVRARFWANPYPPTHSLHATWRLDIEEVREHLRALRRMFPLPAVKIDYRSVPGPVYCYDPWSFRESAQLLEDEGLAMVEVPQTDARLVPAARQLYDLVVERRLVHDGDPTFADHLRSVTAKARGTGWRLTKPHGSGRRIDGAAALLDALTEAMGVLPPRRPTSAYLA